MRTQSLFPNRRLLEKLQRKALSYFLENQLAHGLVLDRQRNRGRRQFNGICSTSATGMGLVAIALAASDEYGLISKQECEKRVRNALNRAFQLPQVRGIMPHFTRADGLTPVGSDFLSTIDSAWLIAGALAATSFPWLNQLQPQALQLYDRVNWRYWSLAARYTDLSKTHNLEPLIRHRRSKRFLLHGMNADGKFIPYHWDLLNAETAFMYVLATGAGPGKNVSSRAWTELCRARADGRAGTATSELGLFVSQYSLELLDFAQLPFPGGINLLTECAQAVTANHQACRRYAAQFQTYRWFWGLSAGDGPALEKDGVDEYRPYGPVEPPPVDGTAHVLATLASLAVEPALVSSNLQSASSFPALLGRYGYSNVNLDRAWFSRDVVGIDLGAAVMALDNVLHANRIKGVFSQLKPVRSALYRLNKLSGTAKNGLLPAE